MRWTLRTLIDYTAHVPWRGGRGLTEQAFEIVRVRGRGGAQYRWVAMIGSTEIGYVSAAYLETTGRATGRELGPSVELVYASIEPEYRNTRYLLRTLLCAAVEFIEQWIERDDLYGLIFEAAARSVAQLARHDFVDVVDQVPFYRVVSADNMHIARERVCRDLPAVA